MPRRPLRAIVQVLLGTAVLAVTASTPDYYSANAAPGDYVKRVFVQGRWRSYRLHVPLHYNGTRSFPVVFAFHGSSASASVIERETSFDDRADSLGFFVVYPEGLHRAWNIGECCRYSFTHNVNEVAFVSAILDELERGVAVDRTRVYMTGYSDGGTLSYILGCTIPNRVAAVAVVSGTLFEPPPVCPLSRAMPVMLVHGTADNSLPYGGKAGGPPWGKTTSFTHSAPDVARFWVVKDRCRTPGDSTRSGNVVRVHYACADDAEVLFYTIVNGAHGWPGGGRGWVFSPKPPKDMVATDSIVRFLWRHRLRV